MQPLDLELIDAVGAYLKRIGCTCSPYWFKIHNTAVDGWVAEVSHQGTCRLERPSFTDLANHPDA